MSQGAAVFRHSCR